MLNEIPFVTHEYFQRAKLFAAIRGFLYFIKNVFKELQNKNFIPYVPTL